MLVIHSTVGKQAKRMPDTTVETSKSVEAINITLHLALYSLFELTLNGSSETWWMCCHITIQAWVC